MNKKVLKGFALIIIIFGTMMLLSTASNAASLSVSTSKSSVSPGEVFTATITLSGGAGPISASVQNGSGSGTQFLDNGSMSISCTAGSSGTVTISASGTVGDYTTEEDVPVSGSASVQIIEPEPEPEPVQTPVVTQTTTQTNPSVPSKQTTPTQPTTSKTETKSSNSKLEKLEIAEGVLSPEFDEEETEYTINLPNEITKLSIAATADHSRATVEIVGNEELKEGENEIEVIVTAEDGSKTTYKITAIRQLPELSLQMLNVYYIDKDGTRVNLVLNPQFVFNTYEYTILEKLPYSVKSLQVEATANREGAEIKITGDSKLQVGTNEILVTITTYKEAEEQEEVEIEENETLEEIVVEPVIAEQKTYKITVEREEEPVVIPLTTGDKIKNWFSGIGGGAGRWILDHFDKIVSGMLLIATANLIGLTLYFAVDYKKYQSLLVKIAELNKANLMEKANAALNPDSIETTEIQEVQEQNEEQTENQEKIKTKGRRFK